MSRAETPERAQAPEILNVDEQDLEFYADEKSLLFTGTEKLARRLSNTERFLLALAYGVRYGAPVPLKKRISYIRMEYVDLDTKAVVMAAVTAHNKGDPSILLDQPTTWNLAEQFAHAGVQLIRQQEAYKRGAMIEELEAFVVTEMDDVGDKPA